MTFELFRSEKNQQYYFRLCDPQGNICLKSEGYLHKRSCEKGIRSVERNGGDETKYNLKFSKKQQYYFNLKARNGQVIATSLFFPSEEETQSRIKSIITHLVQGD